jgi:hypothetical protein
MPISDELKAIVGEGHTKRPYLILMSEDNTYYCLSMTGSKLEVFTQYHLDKNDYGFPKSGNINLDKIYILHDDDIKFYSSHLHDNDIDLLIRLLHTVKHKWGEERRLMFEDKYPISKNVKVGSLIVMAGIKYIVYGIDESNYKCFKVNKMLRSDDNLTLANDYIVNSVVVNISINDKPDVIDNINDLTMKHILLNIKDEINHGINIGNFVKFRTNTGFKKLMVVGFDDKKIYLIDKDIFFQKQNFYTTLKHTNLEVIGFADRRELKKFFDFYFENYNQLSLNKNMYCQIIDSDIKNIYKVL